MLFASIKTGARSKMTGRPFHVKPQLVQVFRKFFLEHVLWFCTDRGGNSFTVFEDVNSGDAGDAILGSDPWVIINVDFRDGDFIGVFFADLLKHWGQLAAWAAPYCPEVDDYWFVRVDDLFLEILICNFNG